MFYYKKLFIAIGLATTPLASHSAYAAPPYYNDVGESSSGLWDWNNKGNVIGGGDGNSGELTLQGSASYNNAFTVGYNGGNGTLTIKDNAAFIGDITHFSVGTAESQITQSNETTGVLNLIGNNIGLINATVLKVGDTSVYDRYTQRDKSVTGILNILDGARVSVGPVSGSPGNAMGGIVWAGSGNSANKGIININGKNSSLHVRNEIIESSPYIEDGVVDGNVYLGYLGDADVNISNGGSFITGRMIASFARKNDDINSLVKTPTVNINVTGSGSKLGIQSLLALASSEGGNVFSIDFHAQTKGVGTAVLTVEDGAEVYFEGKAYMAADGFGERTSGLFLASDLGSSATVNLNSGGTISISDSSLSPTKDGIVAGDGSYDFNLNGGTLRVNSCEYCDNKLTTAVNMNVLSESVLEADTDKKMMLNGNLVGNGGLVKTGEGTVIFSGENNYTGGTRVEAGEVRSNASKAFVDNTTYIVNGGRLNLNHHDLIMSSLSGSGGVVDVTSADLTINQNNNSYFAGQFDGSGTIAKSGTAQLALSGDSRNYSGITTIYSGNLDSTNALGGQIIVKPNALLSATGYLGETTTTPGSTLFVGSLYHANQPSLSALTIDNHFSNQGNTYVGRVNNDAKSLVGNRLLVNGNYQGGGSLHFNTVAGDDNSVTDRMTIMGNTSGETSVYVTNVGGMGDYTEKGIELISVRGQSDGVFNQAGRITAGAYEYFLNRGNAEKGADSKNWYLTNYRPNPNPAPETSEPTIRPEAGGYIHNIASSNMLFVHRLHDRLGETYYTDALTGEEKVTSMWMRNVGGHTRSRDSSGQLKTQANRYILHLGGDVAQWSNDGQDRWHIGVMGGYTNSHSNTRSSITDYRADSSVSGYSLGGYGTWQQNKGENTGAYVDTWALYSWFDNQVKGQGLAAESYKSKGVTASLETGYTFKTGEYRDSKDEINEWFVQPQAQIVWMGVKADSFAETNGTRIHSKGAGNIQTRLGVRTFIKGHHQSDEGKEREFEPFVEANWIHNTKKFSTEMGNRRITQAGADNVAELKLGVEGQINRHFNMWGNVGVQVGDSGYSDTAFMLGIKYNFGQSSK